ncbi:DUF2793 domain-containing protein [Pseudomonas sp.]|uniref:DUF2793 domain-containing protein n=1 Tax=Pseudomonas sp. TaxID=306 RepID=UPI003FD77459
MNTISNAIPFVPENTIDPAAGINNALIAIDVLLQLAFVSVGLNAPAASPADGARFAVGTAPTGLWAGKAGMIASWTTAPGFWTFQAARYGYNLADSILYVRNGNLWAPAAAAGLSNPMTTPADLIIGGVAGAPMRLAAGVTGQVLTRTAKGLEWAAPSTYGTVVIEAATARTLILADAGTYLRMTGAAPAITVPLQATIAWVDNTEITIRHAGAGTLTLAPASGVTLNTPNGGTLTMAAAMTVTLKRVAINVWDVLGQTVAA